MEAKWSNEMILHDDISLFWKEILLISALL